MSSLGGDRVIYPVVVVTVDGIECGVLLDSGSSSCYASAKLLDMLGKRPTEIKPKRVEMLMASSTARMEIYKTTVSTRSGDFTLDVNLTKVNRGELLSIENLKYDHLMKTSPHLKGLEVDDADMKTLLPVHVRGSYRGGLSHGSRTEKTANHGSRISKFHFPESRK